MSTFSFFFLSFDSATPYREDYAQVDYPYSQDSTKFK